MTQSYFEGAFAFAILMILIAIKGAQLVHPPSTLTYWEWPPLIFSDVGSALNKESLVDFINVTSPGSFPSSFTEHSHMVHFLTFHTISTEHIQFSEPFDSLSHHLPQQFWYFCFIICVHLFLHDSNSHPKSMLALSLSILVGMLSFILINSLLTNFVFWMSSLDFASSQSSPIGILSGADKWILARSCRLFGI